MDLKGIGFASLDLIQISHDRSTILNTVINLWVPDKSMNFLTFRATTRYEVSFKVCDER